MQVFASFDAQSDMQLIDIGSAKLGSSAPEMYDLWKPVERTHERRDRALFLYRQRPQEHSERFGGPPAKGVSQGRPFCRRCVGRFAVRCSPIDLASATVVQQL